MSYTTSIAFLAISDEVDEKVIFSYHELSDIDDGTFYITREEDGNVESAIFYPEIDLSFDIEDAKKLRDFLNFALPK